MAVAINDILRITIVSTQGDQTAYNVLHYRVALTGGISLTEVQIANTFRSAIAAVWAPILNNNANLYGVMCQKIAPGIKGAVFNSAAAVVPGTSGAVAVPKQTAFVIGIKTPTAGRSYRGRIYLPFPSETDNDGQGIPTATYVVNAAAVVGEIGPIRPLVDGADSVGLTHGVWSPKLQSFSTAVTYSLKQRWGTQRRRGSYGRANPPPF